MNVRSLGLGLVLVSGPSSVGHAAPAPRLSVPTRFAVLDLGVLSGDTTSSATGVNDAGQVVGVSKKMPGAEHAWIWSNGALVSLGDLGIANAHASGINNLGQVVGSAQTANARIHAWVWNPTAPNATTGTMTDLGLVTGGEQAEALAINDGGVITGVAAPPVFGAPGSLAIHTNGQWSILDPPPALATGLTGGLGWAINNTGQVAGALLYHFTFRACLYSPGSGIIDLSSSFNTDSYARGINSAGTVAGVWGNADNAHAFLWQPDAPNGTTGTATTLPSVGTSAAGAFAINDAGWVVGAADPFVGQPRALLWMDGTPIDLNTRIDPAAGWQLSTATAVNNHGWIVGEGQHNGQTHAFLLAPPGVASFTAHIGKGPFTSTLTVPGSKAVRGMVSILPAAPVAGAKVTFTSDNPAVVPAPKTVSIKAGAFGPKKPFKIPHKKVKGNVTVHLIATYNGGSQVLTLNLQP